MLDTWLEELWFSWSFNDLTFRRKCWFEIESDIELHVYVQRKEVRQSRYMTNFSGLMCVKRVIYILRRVDLQVDFVIECETITRKCRSWVGLIGPLEYFIISYLYKKLILIKKNEFIKALMMARVEM